MEPISRHADPLLTAARVVVTQLNELFATLPNAAWDENAAHLDWTNRETVGHMCDDLVFYAMQLAGDIQPQSDYVPFLDSPALRTGGPELVFNVDPALGSEGVVLALEAAVGVFAAVLAATPADKRGYHPRGRSDARGFGAMGAVEVALHGYDILASQGIDYHAPDDIAAAILDRLFPTTATTTDPWSDLLRASGRHPDTRGLRWTWDANVREEPAVAASIETD